MTLAADLLLCLALSWALEWFLGLNRDKDKRVEHLFCHALASLETLIPDRGRRTLLAAAWARYCSVLKRSDVFERRNHASPRAAPRSAAAKQHINISPKEALSGPNTLWVRPMITGTGTG
jgi:hypothetical protein